MFIAGYSFIFNISNLFSFRSFFFRKKAKLYDARNDEDQIEIESKTDICPRISYGQFQTCLKNVDSFVFFFLKKHVLAFISLHLEYMLSFPA